MFTYKGRRINLEDVSKVFKNCSEDVRDELRLSALDDTPIAPFIDVCGNDSYKLGQFRLALRDMMPTEYFCTDMTGKGIYLTRQVFKNVDTSLAENLLRYIKDINTLTIYPETYEVLAEFTLLRVDISRVDFTKIPRAQVLDFCKGLQQGYPMWLFVGVDADDEKFHILKRAMQKGVDVHQFMDSEWTSEQLFTLLAYADDVDLNNLLQYVNHNFSTAQLEVLLDDIVKGLPVDLITVQDSDGYPLYNEYQMQVLSRAIARGVVTPTLFDPDKSDKEMEEILDGVVK